MPLDAADPLNEDVAAISRLSAVPTILRVISETTGLRFSLVARVTEDKWVACAVHDEIAFGLRAGDTLDVATTLCSKVRDTQVPVVIDHATEDSVYAGHPTPKMYGFESYIAVPIFLADGTYFGTVCALDPLPAKVNQPKVIETMKLFAQLVSSQLAVEARESSTRVAKQRLESFVADAPATIAVFRGPSLVYELANERYCEFVGEPNLVGKPVRRARPGSDTQAVADILERVYATGEKYVATEMAIPHHGRTTYFDWVAQPTTDAEGRVDGVLSFGVDVTERVLARQELEQTNQELDKFASVASHDLKAPLRGIGNIASWLEEDLGDGLSGESRQHLHLLRRRVNHMNALIDGVLRYSRASSKLDVATEVDVRELLGGVVELVAPREGAVIDLDDSLPRVIASKVALEQVFLNLISNALKHTTRSDARVTIRAEDGGPHWIFSVADNGPGIAPEYHEKIWALFQTLGNSDGVDNTGIGLSIVKKAVEAHGGDVWLTSAIGEGSTFFFSWPKQPPRFK